jgi:predicted enzyme related to lactoylglutathione lyase
MPARKKTARKVAKRKPAARKKAAPSRKAAPKKAAPRRPAAAPAVPSAIGMQNHHLDYTTHNLDAVKRFYVEYLGFKNHQQDPQFNYLWVQTGHSSSLGFMPPMEGMGEPSPAKEPTLYLMVADVDKAYATLAARGVMFDGPPRDMPWGHRVCSTTDPEGRRVMLATRKAM